ncbi:MAG: dTDP-4-dehydrorhamnose 3,5-epimerase [Candidatus Rokuibacteriota bacterium]
MTFEPTPLPGAWVVEPERHTDHRGFFARTWCAREFETRGLSSRFVQCGISFNKRRGTLRGLHYQAAPHQEVKLVRCTMGAIHDVIIDLRPESPTFMQHAAVTLSAENRTMVYVPEGFAHGFQTLEDDTEVLYQISAPHAPAAARGVRWNDPAFAIPWPPDDRVIAARDRQYPDFVPAPRGAP